MQCTATRFAAIAMAITATALQGCASLMPDGIGTGARHDSALLVDGHDGQGRLREDSLDVVDLHLWWMRQTADGGHWFAQAGAGYKWREAGFETDGKPIVGSVQFARRWRFNRH